MFFTWGNIFIGEDIKDATVLAQPLGLDSWLPKTSIEVWETLQSKKKAIEGLLQCKEVNISLISYPENKACVDFHCVKEDEMNKKLGTARLENDLLNKYNQYTNVIVEGMDESDGQQDNGEGHWISSYEPAKKIEMEFIEIAKEKKEHLMDVVLHGEDYAERAAAIYMLHWGENKEEILSFLLTQQSQDPDHTVHNNLVRAVIALTKIVPMKQEYLKQIFEMLYHPSTACINKGLMLIWELMERGQIHKEDLDEKTLRRIELIADKVKQFNLQKPASLITAKTK